MHSNTVYLSTQLYIYTSPFCVLTNIKAYMQVLCLKDLSKNEKKHIFGGPIKLIISMVLKVSLLIYR